MEWPDYRRVVTCPRVRAAKTHLTPTLPWQPGVVRFPNQTRASRVRLQPPRSKSGMPVVDNPAPRLPRNRLPALNYNPQPCSATPRQGRRTTYEMSAADRSCPYSPWSDAQTVTTQLHRTHAEDPHSHLLIGQIHPVHSSQTRYSPTPINHQPSNQPNHYDLTHSPVGKSSPRPCCGPSRTGITARLRDGVVLINTASHP